MDNSDVYIPKLFKPKTTPSRSDVKKNTSRRPSIPMVNERWAFAQSVPAGEVPMKVQLRTKRRLVFWCKTGGWTTANHFFSHEKKPRGPNWLLNRERLVMVYYIIPYI